MDQVYAVASHVSSGTKSVRRNRAHLYSQEDNSNWAQSGEEMIGVLLSIGSIQPFRGIETLVLYPLPMRSSYP